MEVDEKIFNSTSIQIEVLETSKALKRFNELKSKGKRVSAVIHSTC